jgi:chromate transporter
MKDIARLFFKLGCLGFGGPIATMAMMEEETVARRNWITRERFNQAYALVKTLPGPAATQLAIYLGQVRGGRLGGLIAGGLFIFPAFFLVLVLSFFYEKVHTIPTAEALFQGMQVAALVVILDSVLRMAKPYSKSGRAIAIGIITGAVIYWSPRLEPVMIIGAGLFGAFAADRIGALRARLFSAAPVFQLVPALQLVMVCFKAGFLVFGTGLAIVPLLEGDVVGHYHWLTHSEFLDGLAIGQITPGPVVITSTFIGYRIGGLMAATMATMAMFAPGFFNILIVIPIIEKRIQNSPRLKGFTNWAIPTVIGGIIATTFRLGIISVTTPGLAMLLVLSGIWVFKLRPPVWIVIPICGIVNFIFQYARG